MLAEDASSFTSAGPEVVDAGQATAATAAVAAATAAHPPCDDDCSSAPTSLRARSALPSEAHAEGAAAVTFLGKGNVGGGAVASPPAVVHNAAIPTGIADPSPSLCLPVPRPSASVGAFAAQLAAAPSPTRTCAHSILHASRSQWTSYVSSQDAGLARGGESNELRWLGIRWLGCEHCRRNSVMRGWQHLRR